MSQEKTENILSHNDPETAATAVGNLPDFISVFLNILIIESKGSLLKYYLVNKTWQNEVIRVLCNAFVDEEKRSYNEITSIKSLIRMHHGYINYNLQNSREKNFSNLSVNSKFCFLHDWRKHAYFQAIKALDFTKANKLKITLTITETDKTNFYTKEFHNLTRTSNIELWNHILDEAPKVVIKEIINLYKQDYLISGLHVDFHSWVAKFIMTKITAEEKQECSNLISHSLFQNVASLGQLSTLSELLTLAHDLNKDNTLELITSDDYKAFRNAYLGNHVEVCKFLYQTYIKVVGFEQSMNMIFTSFEKITVNSYFYNPSQSTLPSKTHPWLCDQRSRLIQLTVATSVVEQQKLVEQILKETTPTNEKNLPLFETQIQTGTIDEKMHNVDIIVQLALTQSLAKFKAEKSTRPDQALTDDVMALNIALALSEMATPPIKNPNNDADSLNSLSDEYFEEYDEYLDGDGYFIDNNIESLSDDSVSYSSQDEIDIDSSFSH